MIGHSYFLLRIPYFGLQINRFRIQWLRSGGEFPSNLYEFLPIIMMEGKDAIAT